MWAISASRRPQSPCYHLGTKSPFRSHVVILPAKTQFSTGDLYAVLPTRSYRGASLTISSRPPSLTLCKSKVEPANLSRIALKPVMRGQVAVEPEKAGKNQKVGQRQRFRADKGVAKQMELTSSLTRQSRGSSGEGKRRQKMAYRMAHSLFPVYATNVGGFQEFLDDQVCFNVLQGLRTSGGDVIGAQLTGLFSH